MLNSFIVMAASKTVIFNASMHNIRNKDGTDTHLLSKEFQVYTLFLKVVIGKNGKLMTCLELIMKL